MAEQTQSHSEKHTFGEWYGVLGGAIAWAMQLEANYALVQQACANGDMRWIYISTAVFLLLALSAVFVAGHEWASARREAAPEPSRSRSAFMGLLGLLTSSLFALIILAHAIAMFMFNPCEQ
jgi:hypothetical protein